MKISKETFGVENEAEMICVMVSIVINSLKNAYPELEKRKNYIQEVFFVMFMNFKLIKQ